MYMAYPENIHELFSHIYIQYIRTHICNMCIVYAENIHEKYIEKHIHYVIDINDDLYPVTSDFREKE